MVINRIAIWQRVYINMLQTFFRVQICWRDIHIICNTRGRVIEYTVPFCLPNPIIVHLIQNANATLYTASEHERKVISCHAVVGMHIFGHRYPGQTVTYDRICADQTQVN